MSPEHKRAPRTGADEPDLGRLAARALDIIYRYRLQPTRGFEYVSGAATRITGYTPEEHYADPDLGFKLVHPDDRPLLTSLTHGAASAEPLRLRWVRKDGATIWTEQRNTVVHEHGDAVAIEGIAREIPDPTRRPGEAVRILDGLRIDLALQGVIVDGKPVHLTPSEFRLLALLTADPGTVFSRAQITRRLWRSGHAGTAHTCETHVSALRRKIERDPHTPERIRTVRGRGYVFVG